MKLNEQVARELLGDPDTQGLVLLTILLDAFGEKVVGEEMMEPAELWAEVNDRFGCWIPEEGENKVNALITACVSENFYRDPETFTALCMSLASGDMGDMIDGSMEELEAFEAVWGCVEVMLARQDDEEVEMSGSVQALFDAALKRDTEANVQREVRAELDDMKSRFARLGVQPHHIDLLGV